MEDPKIKRPPGSGLAELRQGVQPRQEPGIKLSGVPVHAQELMTPGRGLGMSGVKVTDTSAISLAPLTVMIPVVLATATDPAYLVVVLLLQVLKFVALLDWLISETQVRAELAASTTSDTLAFFV